MTRGAWGEQAAAGLLERQGCRVLARNYRTRYGEIDIIAEKAGFLLFVEVKTRKNSYFAAACEAVTPKKQEKLRLAALQWLQEHPTGLQPRFDVVEVYGGPGGPVRTRVIENAFSG